MLINRSYGYCIIDRIWSVIKGYFGIMSENNEEKNYSDENKKRMMVAIAILLGFIDSKEDYPKLTKPQKAEVKKIFDQRQLHFYTDNPQRLSERDIQIQVAEQGITDKIDLYKIVGVKDNKTCPDCAAWQGKTVSMNPNGKYPTVQDFINNHGFHPNCRCSLQEIKTDEIPLKSKINPRYESRRSARPDIYNNACKVLKSNTYFCINTI